MAAVLHLMKPFTEPARPRRHGLGNDQPDGALVVQAQEGSRWAERALYQRYAHEIANLGARMLRSREDGEDVAHDTFVYVFESLTELREPQAFHSWLRRIAVRFVHRRLRGRKLRGVFFLGGGPETALPLAELADASATPETLSDLRVIDRLLDRLPTNDRAAWMLRHVEGYSLQEAADACGCSLATVKRRISAAQRRIDRSLDVTKPGGVR